MSVQIRPLRPEDINRVVKIERQAFPTLWPPTPFKRDLDNRMAKYLVASHPRAAGPAHEKHPAESPFGHLLNALKGLLYPNKDPVVPDNSLLGFVGLWFMAGEAHITAIAVEEESRGKGLGELLLIGSIELAMSQQAREMSLEARVSNYVAQSLYEKYGFEKVGIRKGYYTDNREDAVIMTTQPISDPAYQEKFRALKEAYEQRRGEIRIELT
jgi:ribosomal-protein-alanine N-acetyltransferase